MSRLRHVRSIHALVYKMTEWYKIPEIRFADYVECLKGVYAARDAPIHAIKDVRDPFLKAVVPYLPDEEIARQRGDKIAQELGNFHQKLMGKIPGYTDLGRGHASGLDLMKTDGTEFWEVKNRHNTMNSGSAKTVLDKLLEQKKKGAQVFLVQVNCPDGKVIRHGFPTDVNVFNGSRAYAHMAGRESFWNDLIDTMTETFKRFANYSEIVRFAEQLPVPISQEQHSRSACIEQQSLP
jgi:Eco47II restriction endonuclease